MSKTNIKSPKQPGSRRSSILMAILLIPLITLTFLSGIYVGSKFVDGDSTTGSKLDAPQVLPGGSSQGLPGTNNVLRRWSEGNMKYLRGAAAELMDVAKRAEILVGLSPPAPQTHLINNQKSSKINEETVVKKEEILKGLSKPLMPNSMYNQPPEPQHIVIGGMQVDGHVVSGSQQKEELKRSLHADMLSFMTGPNSLDDSNILVGAWVYLDKSETNDNNMRTIFTNKKSGCTNLKDQYGLSMYVNAWETSNHLLYVEYGGLESGCHKLDSNGVQLHPEQWYHVAVHLGDTAASLYIDGTIVSSSSGGIEKHEVQTDLPLRVGQYDGGTFPLFGNISHLAFVHCLPDWSDSIMGNVVKSMMDLSLVGKIKGLHALYTFTDAAEEISGSPAVEEVSGLNGKYFFQTAGKKYPGVPINLIDGVDGRPVTQEMRDESDKVSRVRREKVKEGMKHAWKGYKTYAWGYDEVKPMSHVGTNPWGGMGVTLVDSLDTLWIMGMKEEFAEARDWVKNSLTFRNAGSVSLFETTIRELGGLLSAFDLSGDSVFLDKAKELGDLLMPGFNTQSGIPSGQVNLRSQGQQDRSGGTAVLSELGTLQIEFRNLGHYLKNLEYEKKAMRPIQVMRKADPSNGLYPIRVNIADGSFAEAHITLGALGDSFYEYMLKVWIQGGKKEMWLREMYDKAVEGVIKVLLQASTPSGMAFLSDWTGSSNQRKMDHLVCFMPGVLALGAHTDPTGPDSVRAKRDLAVAKALMHTCHEMYTRQSSGIAPEYVEFPEGEDMTVTGAPFYILRPETAESLFVLNQLTGDPIYRDWAWGIFESINKHCRTDVAYGALRDVNSPSGGVDDRMESFFLAETMKYLYLALDPDNTIDLDKYVINTEAHPTRIFDDSHVPVESSYSG